jgi:hypothetical protein
MPLFGAPRPLTIEGPTKLTVLWSMVPGRRAANTTGVRLALPVDLRGPERMLSDLSGEMNRLGKAREPVLNPVPCVAVACWHARLA